VCITRSDELRYRTITRKRLLALRKQEAPDVLLALYKANLATLGRAPEYCRALGTKLYRISSSVFPFADEPIGIALLDELTDELAAVGERFRAFEIRAVMHPDQYVVLNSDSPEVVANSVKILTMHARVVDALGLPATPWTALEIHGGKANRAIELVETIRSLPDNIRQRLVLENDERCYGAEQMLEICEAAGVPMVFDAHHHVCYEKLDSFEHSSIATMTTAAANTWPDRSWQLCHISNGREGINDRRHSDEIDVMPSAFARVPWIEIEAKSKEQAIRRLQTEWLPSLGSR
jgi:UV DNA damage endonuclease